MKEIHSRVVGPPGLGRGQIEELIDADWAMIAADKSVLLESRWRLETFHSLASTKSGSERDTDDGIETSSRTTLKRMAQGSAAAWVLMVTQGTIHAYPPEFYVDRGRAAQEAERWAWILSGEGVAQVDRPFEGRWVVGDFDLRLVPLDARPADLAAAWVGTYWREDGTPDPEAIVFANRAQALAWTIEPLEDGSRPASVDQSEWFVVATFPRKGEEAHAVAHRAKFIM